MVWAYINRKIIEVLRTVFPIDAASKFENITSCIGEWMRHSSNYQRRTMTKRLRKRQHRLSETCKTMKRGSCKCNCNKCTNIRLRKQRIIGTDLLGNLPYQHRIWEDGSSILGGMQTDLEHTAEISSSRQDHRDLQQLNYDELVSWTNITHINSIPPLHLEHLTKPSQSECSITSDFFSDSAEMMNLSGFSRSSTLSSDDSDYQSCRDISDTIPLIHAGSQCDPKIPWSSRIKLKSVAKSVAIPLGQPPRELRCLKTAAKRKAAMKRPVRKTTSHMTDCFSNIVKCSKIVSRPYRKNTH